MASLEFIESNIPLQEPDLSASEEETAIVFDEEQDIREAPLLEEETVKQRANKYNLAVRNLFPDLTTEDVVDIINNGAEQAFAFNTKIAEDTKKSQENELRLSEFIRNRPSNKPIDDAESTVVNYLIGLDTTQEQDNTTLERNYAENQILTTKMMGKGESSLIKAFEPARFSRQMNAFEREAINSLTKKEVLQKKLENLEAQQKKQSPGTRAYELFETFFPFFTWQNIIRAGSELNPEIQSLNNALEYLPGELIQNKVANLLRLPPPEFERVLEKTLNRLAESNLDDAIFFARAVGGFTTQERYLENLFGVVDLGILGGIARGITKRVLRVAKAGSGETDVLNEAVQRMKRVKEQLSKPQQRTVNDILAELSATKANSEVSLSPVDEAVLSFRNMAELADDLRSSGKDVLEELNKLGLKGPADFNAKRKELFKRFDLTDKPRKTETVDADLADEAADTLKNISKAANTRNTRPEDLIAAAGNLEESAYILAKRKVLQQARVGIDARGLQELIKNTPSLFAIDSFLEGSYKLAREQSDRLVAGLQSNAKDLLQSLSEVQGISRLQDEALEEAIKQAKKDFNERYNHLSDTVLDVVPQAAEDINLLNIDRIEIRLGTKDGDLFKTAEQADNVATNFYKLGDDVSKDYVIKKNGDGYYVSISRNVDETLPSVRELRLKTRGETPVASYPLMFNWLHFLRSPEDLLSVKSRSDRLVATYGGQELLRLQQDVARGIGKLRKRSREDLKGYINEQRTFQHRDSNGQFDGRMGRYDASLREFEENWQRKYNRLPTQKEAQAYFSFIQMSDLDWLVRNFSLYKDKARVGIENFSFEQRLLDDTTGQRNLTSVRGVEGKRVNNIPWGTDEDAGITILRSDGDVEFYRKNHPNLRQVITRNIIDKLIEKENYQIIQLTDQGEQTLRDSLDFVSRKAGKEKINFMVVQSPQTRALPWKQIPYQPGFHIEYPGGFFVRQAKIKRLSGGRHRYDGDVNILHFNTKSEAQHYAKAMDEARQMIVASRGIPNPDVDSFIQKNLPWTTDQFEALFTSGKLNIEDPIRFSFDGKSISDDFNLTNEYSNFIDGTKSQYNLYNSANLKFAQSRDPLLNTVVREGTADSPIYNLKQAELLDPFVSLNRSAKSLVNNRLLDDMKLNAAEDFIKQFGDLLDGDIAEMLQDPFDTLLSRQFKERVTDTDKLRAARTARRTAKELLGIRSEHMQSVEWQRQKLADMIFEATGGRAVKLTDAVRMGQIKDPATFLRSVAFHTKLALWNPVQLLLQAQSLTHMASLAGMRNATAAMPAYWMSRVQLGYKAENSRLAHIAEKLVASDVTNTWKKEWFMESHEALRRSGLGNVGGEVAFRDDTIDPKLIRSSAGRFLEKGTFFFAEGERMARIASWHGAYLEWRRANPKARFNREAQQQVLQRADMMTVNMSRASNARWQQGFLSVPTQFFAYNARLMEQVLGKRLTAKERMRGALVYSSMYGIPIGIGGTSLGVWPWYEEWREYLVENDIPYSDTAVFEALSEGLPNLVLEWATGTNLNFEERYGPGGNTWFKELVNAVSGIKTIDPVEVPVVGEPSAALSVLRLGLGVSGSIMSDLIRTSEPMTHALLSLFNENKDERYPLKLHDFVKATKEIASLNLFMRSIAALQTGKYISKHGIELDDINTIEALFVNLGLTPQRVSDTFRMLESNAELKQVQKHHAKRVVENVRKAFENTENPEQFEDFMKRARLHIEWGMFTGDQEAQLLGRVIQDETVVESVMKSFMDKRSSREGLTESILDRLDQRDKELGNK